MMGICSLVLQPPSDTFTQSTCYFQSPVVGSSHLTMQHPVPSIVSQSRPRCHALHPLLSHPVSGLWGIKALSRKTKLQEKTKLRTSTGSAEDIKLDIPKDSAIVWTPFYKHRRVFRSLRRARYSAPAVAKRAVGVVVWLTALVRAAISLFSILGLRRELFAAGGVNGI